MQTPKPLFEIGEMAILQPPHSSAKAYWGMETTILDRSWSCGEDAFGGLHTGWSYRTDVQAPPPDNDPCHQHIYWTWCEYDLRKKYDEGQDFKTLLQQLDNPMPVIEISYETPEKVSTA